MDVEPEVENSTTDRAGEGAQVGAAAPVRPPSVARKGRITAWLLLVLPVLAGVAAALRWGSADEDAYIAISQLIATLLVAVALEFFSDSSIIRGTTDSILIYSLLATSWSGVFASAHAILQGTGSFWTAGVSSAGIVSTAILVGLALLARLRTARDTGNFGIIGVIVFPAIVFLVIL